MSRLLFPVMFCLATAASAQTDTLRSHDRFRANNIATGRMEIDRPDHFLAITARGAYDANTVRNELVRALYDGDVLSRELRQRTADALNDGNRAGYELDFEASYAWNRQGNDQRKLRPRISAGYHNVMGLRFADDLYSITFFGNAAFEDRNARLGPSAFEQVTYQTIGFGLEDRASRSFLEVELVNGQSLNAGRIDRANLFTATDGRYLDLDLDGHYDRSDTGTTGKSNGIGAALNIGVQQDLRLFGRRSHFRFTAQDVGFVAWNKQSLQVDHKGIIRYEGIRVDDILDLDGLLVGKSELQDTLGLAYTSGSVVRILPFRAEARMEFGKAHDAVLRSGAYAYMLEVDQRNLPGYVPHVALARGIGICRNVRATVQGSFGGFGGFRGGAGIDAWIVGIAHLRIDAPNVIGLVSDSASGKAVMAELDFAW